MNVSIFPSVQSEGSNGQPYNARNEWWLHSNVGRLNMLIK